MVLDARKQIEGIRGNGRTVKEIVHGLGFKKDKTLEHGSPTTGPQTSIGLRAGRHQFEEPAKLEKVVCPLRHTHFPPHPVTTGFLSVMKEIAGGKGQGVRACAHDWQAPEKSSLAPREILCRAADPKRLGATAFK